MILISPHDRTSFRLIALVALMALSCAGYTQHKASENQDLNFIRVSISERESNVVYVEQGFNVTNGVIQMSANGADHLVDGWATFVSEVSAETDDGDALTVENDGKARWKIRADSGEFIRLTYTVTLDHETVEWPHGKDGAAYRTDSGVYYSGRSLFILNSSFDSGVNIRFILPNGWRVSVPWARLDGSDNVYEASNLDAIESALVHAGRHKERILKRGATEFILTFDGAWIEGQADAIARDFAKILDYYVDLVGGPPKPAPGNDLAHVLVILNSGQDETDGEVIGHNINMTINESDPLTPLIYNLVFAHEIFHIWNGKTILRDVTGRADWFGEGWTNFFSIRALRNLKMIDDQQYLMIVTGLLYPRLINDPGYGTTALDEAGFISKSDHWGLIYVGGMFSAVALDFEVRRATGYAKGLDDVLGQIYAEFAGTGDAVSTDDIERVASQVGERDFARFFDEVVRTGNPTKFNRYFGMAGLTTIGYGTAELSIVVNNGLTPQERSLFASMMGIDD